jgi:choline dehydrogenase-like flavoprotein
MTDRYDVIVIGSGGGGGTLTHALAPTGKRIQLLSTPGRTMAGPVPQAAG